MAVLSDTNLNSILVESLNDYFPAVFAKNHPFLDRMAKKKAGGSGFRIPVQTGPGGGAGGDFALSLAGAATNGFTAVGFTPLPANVFGHELIDWNQQPYSDTPQSPVATNVAAMKNAVTACTDNLASMLLGGGYGVMSTISSSTHPSGTLYKLILTVPTDAQKWNQENNGVSKALPASASLDAGTFEVVGVNQIEGSILVDAGSSGWTPTDGHVIGLYGQLVAGTSPTGFQGAFAWVPRAAQRTLGVVGDTFLGVDRTGDSNVVFTSGWAYDGRGLPIYNVMQAAAAAASPYKEAKMDTAYCNPLLLSKLAIECNAQVRIDMPARSPGLTTGFSGFTIVTAAGPIDVLAEPAMPSDAILMTKADTWVYAAPKGGELVRPCTNGKMVIDNFDLNQSRVSCMSTGFFGNENLAASAVITIATPSGLNV
jgi:hypothetical protein